MHQMHIQLFLCSEFLHVYHHSMTMVLCFVELRGKVSMQWVVICLNLFVHVIMYYYYGEPFQRIILFTALISRCSLARTTLFPNQKVWWKRHLTTLQIAQFVIDLGVCYLNTYTHFATKYFASWPNYGPCAGTLPVPRQGALARSDPAIRSQSHRISSHSLSFSISPISFPQRTTLPPFSVAASCQPICSSLSTFSSEPTSKPVKQSSFRSHRSRRGRMAMSRV